MKKFILVDPSFDGVTGDKWQYAVAFARSARRNGYQFVLLSAATSPELPAIDGEPVDQRPIFSFAFYEHEHIVTRHHRTPAALASRRRKHADAVRLQHLRGDVLRRAEEAQDPGLKALAERRIALAERKAARAAARTEGLLAADPDLAAPFNRDDFGVALAAELQLLGLQQGDVLFFHTMTPAMLESFSEVSAHLPGREVFDVDAYCLFHFGWEASDARTFLDRYHSYTHVGSLRQRLAVGSPFRRLHLLATSPILASECRSLLGMPVGVFHGLTNLDDHWRACGGPEAAAAIIAGKARALGEGLPVRFAVRAGDLDAATAEGLKDGLRRLGDYGIAAELRVLYHRGSVSRLRDVLNWFGETPVELVDVQLNDRYVLELARCHVAVLSYVAERYAKRVSAVLHDCAVIGTSCIVPAGTTMAESSEFADVFVYRDVKALGPAMVQAARTLHLQPQDRRDEKVAVARAIYARDVVTAIMEGSPGPAVTVDRRGPVAAFFMPAWGRCGSSYAMEAQIRFLLSRGYFVVQILVMDKPVSPRDAFSYFWRLLFENAEATRGSVQRVAYFAWDQLETLREDAGYAAAPAFEQHLRRIGLADVHDRALEQLLQHAEVAIVNHVFNSRLAKRLVRCPTVLETHDIQSYQMEKWPLYNDADGVAEPLAKLLPGEMAELATFDHVVNVAPDEHRILGLANPRSTLITPYVVFNEDVAGITAPARIADLADAWGLSHYYRDVSRFQMLLLGDSHPANRESAEWFIERVYLPILQPRGRTLVIGGRLSDVLYAKYSTIPNVFYIGFVPSVAVLRRLCDVSVLPDVRGTGISIKTLETFASGQAFVATSRALRGFSGLLPAEVIGHDDPQVFAERVDVLLLDEQERKASERMARRSYEVLASSERFDAAWTILLNAIKTRHGEPAATTVPA